jgi:biopolymer transport protein ExbB/TolQ
MSALTAWILILLLMGFLAWFWVMYLIKVVVNEEELQERIRQIRRRREEERRALEDKVRKRRERQTDLHDGVKDQLHEAAERVESGDEAAPASEQATEA